MENSQILIRPIISEKSLNRAALGWYTFAVVPGARKPEIKKAIEKAFGVKVLSVKTAMMKGKKIRVGKRRLEAKRSEWKKATVRLPTDQKIDVFAAPETAEEAKK